MSRLIQDINCQYNRMRGRDSIRCERVATRRCDITGQKLCEGHCYSSIGPLTVPLVEMNEESLDRLRNYLADRIREWVSTNRMSEEGGGKNEK